MKKYNSRPLRRFEVFERHRPFRGTYREVIEAKGGKVYYQKLV